MFHISCWYNKGHDDQNKVESNYIRRSNCGNQTVLHIKITNTNYKDVITPFVFNTVLQNVGISWIIETNKHLEYDMDKHNSDCITGGTWYNTFLCKKLHGKVFEEFIRNTRTDRYNLMCSIDEQEKNIPSEHDDGSRGGGYPLPLNSTTEELFLLRATIDLICC